MTEKDKLTEEKIFEAATEVFLDKGMDGARMQEIANRAGINKALLHYYYRTKDRLFEAVFMLTVNQMFKKFAPVLDESLSLEDKIRFFYKQHITFLKKNPRLPLFILNEINRNPERIKKMIKNFDIKHLWTTIEAQHRDELEKYNISPETLPQLMTSIAAISLFPFVAKPIVSAILMEIGTNFNDYLKMREDFAADFTIRAIRK
jgi:AcrR family transcriptional regulator